MDNYCDLFIPVVKTYGFVFTLKGEPLVFIINNGKIKGGIFLLSDDINEEEFEDYNGVEDIFDNGLYNILEQNETILVSVDVIDDDLNEVEIEEIDDDNFDNFIYDLTPLKIHTIDNNFFKEEKLSIEEFLLTTLENSIDDIKNEKFIGNLMSVVSEYKDTLEQTKFY